MWVVSCNADDWWSAEWGELCLHQGGRSTREHQGGGGEGAPLLEGARYYVKILQFFWSIAFCHGVTICHMHQGEEMALIRWGLFESCLCTREGGRGWGEWSNPWRGGRSPGTRFNWGEPSKTQPFHGVRMFEGKGCQVWIVKGIHVHWAQIL